MLERIDLHIHTNLSDGTFTPKEVIDEAVKNGVTTLSITDHDTIEAYTNELYEYALSKKINLINGVEISTKVGRTTIHVLGYNFDLKNEEFKNKLYMIRNSRHIYLRDVSQKLEQLGYVVNFEELDRIDSVTKSHIALDIVSNPRNQNKLLEVFGYIPNKGEFIESIMNLGCPGYVKKETITPKEAAELIRKANGTVVLAHPVVYKYIQNISDEEILNIIKDMNADGIEANYIYVDTSGKKINECDKWNKIAKENNLFVTIGSDFHSKNGDHPVIGLLNEDVNFSEVIIENIIKVNS